MSGPVAMSLKFGSPTYNVVKLFKSDTFHNALLRGDDENHCPRLGVGQPAERGQRMRRPSRAHIAHTDGILDATYYRPGFQTARDESERDMWAPCENLRRRRGRESIAHSRGDWRRRQLRHWRGGYCGTKEEAVERVLDWLTAVGFLALSAPRQRKWLQQWPLANDSVLLLNFHICCDISAVCQIWARVLCSLPRGSAEMRGTSKSGARCGK